MTRSMKQTMLYLLCHHMVRIPLYPYPSPKHVGGEGCLYHISGSFSNNSLCVVVSKLLPEAHSPLSRHLLTIPAVTVGVVCLEFKGRVLPSEYEEVSTMMSGCG